MGGLGGRYADFQAERPVARQLEVGAEGMAAGVQMAVVHYASRSQVRGHSV